ncbi:uncharacterized protein LOC125765089 [Anopheles funestus]|uniref:uncharacterized protein LOC125765089 n=1 Tax=Anopheles funestus TaxID=62324 RepID=UPI0020C70BC1|nr:uncharacterized protein LOC125765089 [Anopheles funestus]
MSSSFDSNLRRQRKRYLEDLERETEAEWNQIICSRSDGEVEISFPNMINDQTADTNNNGDGNDTNNFMDMDVDLGNNIDDVDSIRNNVESDHEDADCDGDDNITAGWGTAYSFLEKLTGTEALKYWANLGNLPRSLLNMLLAILRHHFNIDVPKDSRTFLKTRTRTGLEIQSLAGGQFWYQGIKTVLQQHFRNVIPEEDLFTIQVSIDGLPLFRSSKRGLEKPELVEEYFRPLVLEINDLQQRGLQFGNKQLQTIMQSMGV